MTPQGVVVWSVILVSLVGSLSEGGIDNVTENAPQAEPNKVAVEKDKVLIKTSKISCTDPNVSFDKCPSEAICSDLGNECLQCDCDFNCRFGFESEADCRVPDKIVCQGPRQFKRKFTCAFCYQSDPSEHLCEENVKCNSISDPNSRNYIANCSVDNSHLCFGMRSFLKQKTCNWTGGIRWITALILSVTLGGFGADRFYLGHWQEGIGKLFSFGGLGVWTLVDVVMIAIRYIGPADGSVYI